MAKLSDLFGRKGLAGPDKLTGGRNGNGGDPISIENLSDDAPVPPAEAANDEAPSKGKRVKEGP